MKLLPVDLITLTLGLGRLLPSYRQPGDLLSPGIDGLRKIESKGGCLGKVNAVNVCVCECPRNQHRFITACFGCECKHAFSESLVRFRSAGIHLNKR
jgi:hypothetical protein